MNPASVWDTGAHAVFEGLFFLPCHGGVQEIPGNEAAILWLLQLDLAFDAYDFDRWCAHSCYPRTFAFMASVRHCFEHLPVVRWGEYLLAGWTNQGTWLAYAGARQRITGRMEVFVTLPTRQICCSQRHALTFLK